MNWGGKNTVVRVVWISRSCPALQKVLKAHSCPWCYSRLLTAIWYRPLGFPSATARGKKQRHLTECPILKAKERKRHHSWNGQLSVNLSSIQKFILYFAGGWAQQKAKKAFCARRELKLPDVIGHRLAIWEIWTLRSERVPPNWLAKTSLLPASSLVSCLVIPSSPL